MIKENILKKIFVKTNFFPYALKFTVLLGISVAAPFLHFQAVTGTIVNAALIIAVIILGKKEAITIGLFPSLISVVTGFLVPAVVPLIPFIILSNMILILAFDILRKGGYWKGIFWGSILKFSFLYISGIILIKIFESDNLSRIITLMFNWQQLLTALTGGIVAYATLKILKKM